MSRLAQEFGISDVGLAKICNRLSVPYPPRGYWAKKEAEKPVDVLKLLARPAGVAEWTYIYPTPPKIERSAEVAALIATASSAVSKLTVPDAIDDLHPRVKAWISQHKREQKERAQKIKSSKYELWGLRPLADLTKRDLYRFRVTSAIFKGVESAGGAIEEAPITGKVTFRIDGQKVECAIVEKMRQSLISSDPDAANWTAYPEFHQSGLRSSGFLRVAITTFIPGNQPQWVETANKKMAELLPEIVGQIIGTAPVLAEWERERQESIRRHQEEEARRRERQRLRELDARRWAQFQKGAADWEEYARLKAFVAELQRHVEIDGDSQVGELKLSEWIAWAQEKIDTFNPLREGAYGLFESINRA